MKKLLVLLCALLFAGIGYTSDKKFALLQPGDLIFQNGECGAMCEAIKEVTQGYEGRRFSHVGMVAETGSKVYIIEAVGAGVKMTSLDSFLNKTKNKVLVARVKSQYEHLVGKAIQFSMQQIGKPYDDEFLYDNGKYYCSELVYDAFLHANEGKPFFQLEPMTYKQPGSDHYYPVWATYFREKGQDIPEGLPGCNPGGLSRSDKIDVLGEW